MLSASEQDDAAFASTVRGVASSCAKVREYVASLRCHADVLSSSYAESFNRDGSGSTSTPLPNSFRDENLLSGNHELGEKMKSGEGDSTVDTLESSSKDDQTQHFESCSTRFNATAAEVLMDVVSLRYLYREMCLAVRGAKLHLEPLRKKVEASRLDLENLSYEREMLRREVTLVKSYEAPESNALQLASVDEIESSSQKTDLLKSSLQAAYVSGGRNFDKSPTIDRSATSDTLEISETRKDGDCLLEKMEGKNAETLKCSYEGSKSSVQNGLQQLSNIGTTGQGDRTSPTRHEKTVANLRQFLSEKTLTTSERDHTIMLHKLEYELEERKRLNSIVNDIKREHQKRKFENDKQVKFLHLLPERIKQVLNAVGPLRKFFEDDSVGMIVQDCSLPLPKDEAGVLRDLPQPLYVLAREAVAFRDAFQGAVEIHVYDQNPDFHDATPVLAAPSKPPLMTQTSDTLQCTEVDTNVRSVCNFGNLPEAEECRWQQNAQVSHGSGIVQQSTGSASEGDTIRTLHRVHSKFVQIDILDIPSTPGNYVISSPDATRSSGVSSDLVQEKTSHSSTMGGKSNLVLRLSFRLLPKLGIVSLSCSSCNQEAPIATDDLCMLFPYDYGHKSPNPSNSHLLNGEFELDRSLLPDRGRPYLWANLLCGLHFPGAIRESLDAKCHVPAEFQRWCEVASTYPTHLRFKDMVEAIRRRVRAVHSLRSQLSSLSRNVVPISPRQVGIFSNPKSFLRMFIQCPPEMSNAGLELAAAASENYTVVWAFQVEHPDGIVVAGMVGIQPDYPLTAGLFRMKSTSHVVVAEADIREMESEVNVFGNTFALRSDRQTRRAGKCTKSFHSVTSWAPLKYRLKSTDYAGYRGGESGEKAGSGRGSDSNHGTTSGVAMKKEDADRNETVCIPDDMLLSLQVLKLLCCVDVIAGVVIEQAASTIAEIPGAEFVHQKSEVNDDNAPTISDVRGSEDGDVDMEDDFRKERHARLTRGRSRSKSYAF